MVETRNCWLVRLRHEEKGTGRPRYSEQLHASGQRLVSLTIPKRERKRWSHDSPTAQGGSADERRVPDDVDGGRVDSNHNSLKREGNARRSGVLDHDDAISKAERLRLESVDGVSGLDDTLTGKTLDERLLEVSGVSVGVDLVGDELDALDGFLRVEEQSESVEETKTKKKGKLGESTFSSCSAKSVTGSKFETPFAASHFLTSATRASGSSLLGKKSEARAMPAARRQEENQRQGKE